MGCWRGYLSGARCRLAYGPAVATATHRFFVSVKSMLVFPFWYRLTRVVPDKGPLNACVSLFSLVNTDANMPLSTFAAERRAAALLPLGPRRQPLLIDISCRHGAQQQTAVRPCCGRVIGQTDRRMDGRSTVSQTPLCILCGQCQHAFIFYYCGIS